MGSYDAWIGRTEETHDEATAVPVRLMAATLGRDAAAQQDTAVPPGWHWLYFLTAQPPDALGSDGHPLKGGFLPPIPLPRRMRAGGELLIERPIRIGDSLRRRSTIRSVTEKQGNAGPLVFLKIEHAVYANDSLALTESEDIVYREASKLPTAPSASHLSSVSGQAEPSGSTFKTDPVLLFRTSALTFNGHRIHYDLDYAQHEEGYPERVVHGPLIALMMLEHIRRLQPGKPIAQFRYKALAPSFCGQEINVRDRPGDGPGRLLLEARNSGGALAVSGEVMLCV